MELILGAMIVALWVKTIPGVIADAVTTLRASKAGAWDTINKERERKDKRSAGRRQAVSKAWQATRARRNKKAGGDGNYRPGMAAYLGDVYHGLWEDKLERRHAKRAARPPVGPDGRRPAVGRLDQAVEAKVGRQRAKAGSLGRAARLLFDPVGEKRQPADVAPPRSDGRSDGGSVGAPVDPWPLDGDEPTINFAADEPRIACPVCGDTLTEKQPGRWEHPVGSACQSAKQPTPTGETVPAAGNGAMGNVDPQRGQVGGRDHPDRLAEDAPRLRLRQWVDASPVTRPARCETWPDGDDARAAAWDRYRTTVDLYGLGPVCPGCNQNIYEDNGRLACWCTATTPNDNDPTTRATATGTDTSSNGGTAMSTDTIDLVDYNQAVAAHEQALEKLRAQLAEATAFEQHVTGQVAAVEAMDANRSEVTSALAALAEGMEASRYGSDAEQGSAEATSALTAGSIAEVQEHIEAAADRNQRWKEELAASIEGVQASLQHIKSQYGEAAATVQETGIDARALEEH